MITTDLQSTAGAWSILGAAIQFKDHSACIIHRRIFQTTSPRSTVLSICGRHNRGCARHAPEAGQAFRLQQVRHLLTSLHDTACLVIILWPYGHVHLPVWPCQRAHRIERREHGKTSAFVGFMVLEPCARSYMAQLAPDSIPEVEPSF